MKETFDQNGLIIFTLTFMLFALFVVSHYYLISLDQKETIADLERLLMEERYRGAELENRIEGLKKIPAVVTAYAPYDNQSGMCAEGDPSKTSIGLTPSRGVAAVDPARIPYGTKFIVPGYGVVEAGDTGGALRADKDNIRIDIFLETYEQAISWGRQNLEIEIIEG